MKKGQQIAKASLSSLGITSVFGLLIGGEYQYQKWRMSEIEKIDANAKEFLLNGVLKLKNPASNVLKRKQQIWEKYLRPHMIEHWKSQKGDFSIDDKKTWPIGGKNKNFSSTNNELYGCPKLVSENFDVQALICYLFELSFLDFP